MGCLDTIMVLCQGTVTQEDYLYNLLELHPSDYRQRNTSCRSPLPGHRHLIVQWVGVTSPYNMKNIDETEIKLATRFPDIEAGHNQLRGTMTKSLTQSGYQTCSREETGQEQVHIAMRWGAQEQDHHLKDISTVTSLVEPWRGDKYSHVSLRNTSQRIHLFYSLGIQSLRDSQLHYSSETERIQ